MASGAKESIQKMRTHSQYQIGSKIPNSVKPFTVHQIANKNVAGKHSSILRIMTKWAQYLEGILEKPQTFIHNKNYPYKNIRGEIVLVDDQQEKKKLILQLKE